MSILEHAEEDIVTSTETEWCGLAHQEVSQEVNTMGGGLRDLVM